MTASHVNLFYGNPQTLTESKKQIISLLKYMKEIPNFATFFVSDMMSRASATLKGCYHTEDGVYKGKVITLKTLREQV